MLILSALIGLFATTMFEFIDRLQSLEKPFSELILELKVSFITLITIFGGMSLFCLFFMVMITLNLIRDRDII